MIEYFKNLMAKLKMMLIFRVAGNDLMLIRLTEQFDVVERGPVYTGINVRKSY